MTHFHLQSAKLVLGGVPRIETSAFTNNNLELLMWIPCRNLHRLTHTLLQRTLYSKGTLCIVTSCSKEQFASNWHVTVCSLTHFTPQHTLPPGMFFSSAQFASQHPFLLKTPCSSTHFASQHTLLLRTLCSSAHFASKNTLLLGTLYSSTHFAS